MLEALSLVSATQTKIFDNESRINFIKSLNIDIIEEPIEEKEILIPLEFNNVYSKYNQLQLSAGYDLSLYKGKTAKLYKYKTVLQNGEYLFVNLIILDGYIIGGDISSLKINGFMLPLEEYKGET